MPTWADIQRGIFAGESGGDYGALYGFANRPGKMFSDVDVTSMTINELLDFQNPRGEYGNYVSALNEGVASTPAGAYQIVGRTLRDARDRMGLTGGERFTPEMQDRIGRWIYDQQGTGAWEGYQGPQGGDMAYTDQPTQQGGLLSMPEMSQRDRRKDIAGALASGLNMLRQRPDQNLNATLARHQQQRKSNRTAEWLAQQPGGEQLAAMIEAGALSGAQALQAYQASMAGPSYRQMTGAELGMEGENATKLFNVGADGKVTGIGGSGTTVNVGGANSPYQEALDKQAAEIMLKWQTGGSADMSSQRENIALVLGQLEAGQPLTGPMQGAIQALGLGALFDPEATDAKQTVEQVVQRSLRETLGAQFTEKEGERLIQRAYNVSLPPEANARRLAALLNVLDQTISARQSMSDYLRENQTLLGYQGPRLPSTDEGMVSIIDNAMNSAAAAPEASTDPAGLTVGEVQDGYRYIGGPPNLQSSWEKVE